MSKSNIEWCNFTFNPVIGCQKISPGCKNCYAERMAKRLAENPLIPEVTRQAYKDVCKWDGTVRLIPGVLGKIDKIKKPSRIFIGSMTDLFHKNVSLEWITSILATIAKHSQHQFLLLTKRSHLMLERLATFPVLFNMYLGVTAENQECLEERIYDLLYLKEAGYKVFLSCEPLLSAIELSEAVDWLDWVIVGGETGAKSRHAQKDWFVSLAEQCRGKVPYFYKKTGWKYETEHFSYNDIHQSGVTRREFPGEAK